MSTAARRVICLSALIGWLGIALGAGLVWGAERRGSRILAYYRQVSFAAGAPVGSAISIVQVTNGSPTLRVLVRVVLIDAATCEVSNLFTVPIEPGAVARLNVASLAPGSREGVLDAWAINDNGQPIQFNFLSADSTIADLQVPAALQVAAEPLTAILGQYNAPLGLSGQFFQIPGIQQRVVLTRPAPANALGSTLLVSDNIDFHTPDGGVVNLSSTKVASCIIAESLETIYGPGFASGLPNGGTIRVSGSSGPTIPVVGWLLHVFPLAGASPSAFLMGIKLHTEVDGPLP
jgi:hypothetical protein